jgi:hypothetical protein
MKLTNFLLIILICLVSLQKTSAQLKPKPETVQTVSVGRQYTETKTVKAVQAEGVSDVKHSTTFRQYIDTEGRSNQRINHNVRIGKDYYVSGGVYARQSEYSNSAGVDMSITKYW